MVLCWPNVTLRDVGAVVLKSEGVPVSEGGKHHFAHLTPLVY